MTREEEVNPSHYRRFPVEVIDITEHLSFNLGNVVKYVARAGHKPGANELTDLVKASWYLDREKERLGAIEAETITTETKVKMQTHKNINYSDQSYEYFYELMKLIGNNSESNGWHDRYQALREEKADLDSELENTDSIKETINDHIASKIALITSELSEAVEELRKGYGPLQKYYQEDGKPEGFGVELADALIRILDLAYMLDMGDFRLTILEKLQYNDSRGKKHGKRF